MAQLAEIPCLRVDAWLLTLLFVHVARLRGFRPAAMIGRRRVVMQLIAASMRQREGGVPLAWRKRIWNGPPMPP